MAPGVAALPSSYPSCTGVAGFVVVRASSSSLSSSSLSSSWPSWSLSFMGRSPSSAGVLELRTCRREEVAVVELSWILRGRMIILPLAILF